MELYWIYLSFVRKRAPLNIQIKLTNFIKLLNCVSLKSSKNGISIFSGKIELLCLFAIQDEVTGEKSSNLRGNYLRQRRLQNMACFASSEQLQDSLNPSRTPKKQCLKLKF